MSKAAVEIASIGRVSDVLKTEQFIAKWKDTLPTFDLSILKMANFQFQFKKSHFRHRLWTLMQFQSIDKDHKQKVVWQINDIFRSFEKSWPKSRHVSCIPTESLQNWHFFMCVCVWATLPIHLFVIVYVALRDQNK